MQSSLHDSFANEHQFEFDVISVDSHQLCGIKYNIRLLRCQRLEMIKTRNHLHHLAAARVEACKKSLFVWICVFCCPFWAKAAGISQFWPNFHIYWGLLCPYPCTNPVQIWQETTDPWSTLTCQISFESVCCVAFQGQKTILGKFNIGGSYTQPPFNEGRDWCVRVDP